LVESDDLSSSLDDSSSGCLRDTESGEGELGDFQNTGIIGDGTNNDGDVSWASSNALDELSQRDGGLVGSAHDESLQNDAVEVCAGSAREEPVELDQKSKVDIVALEISASLVLLVLVTEIDGHIRC